MRTIPYLIIGYLVAAMLTYDVSINPMDTDWLSPITWLAMIFWPLALIVYLLFYSLVYGVILLVVLGAAAAVFYLFEDLQIGIKRKLRKSRY